MPSRRGRPARLLLVEDDPGDQELTRQALSNDVIKTDLWIASDGEEAIDYLSQRGAFSPETAPRPDLVLLDLNLPRVDGRQVLEWIRAHPDLKRTPVVVLTTSQQEEEILRSYDLGCNSYISKPIQLEPFITVIRSLGHYWFELVRLPNEVNHVSKAFDSAVHRR